MKIISLLVPLCLIAGICTGADTATVAENIVVNGNFNADTQGWRGIKVVTKDGKQASVEAPEFLFFVANDGVGDTKGCLKVSFDNIDNCAPWTTGAHMQLKPPMPANCKVKISFSAKSLNGSRRLVVNRAGGGGGTESVMMSEQWQQFNLFFSSKFDGDGFFFTIIDHYNRQGFVERGEFMLDNISVTIVDPAK